MPDQVVPLDLHSIALTRRDDRVPAAEVGAPPRAFDVIALHLLLGRQVVETRAVRADELAGDEGIARLSADRIVPRRRIRVSEVLDDRVLAVDEGDSPVQVGDDDDALALVEMAGQPEPGHEIDVGAVHRESLQAVVSAIPDDPYPAGAARVDPEARRFGPLAGAEVPAPASPQWFPLSFCSFSLTLI